LILQ
jgi:multiple sugar transport system substrate-binding protein